MQHFLRRQNRPGILIAIIALVVAVSGTSYAVSRLPKNSVGSAQIKNGAVSTPKLASTAAARIAGLTYRKFVFTADAHTGGVAAITCPSGLTAIGGGLETPHTGQSFLLDSHPTATGWELAAANSGDSSESLTAYAICAKVEGATAKTARAASHVRFFRMTH